MPGQPFTAEDYVDEKGTPFGGRVSGPGISIQWQKGLVGTDETGNPVYNGAFVQTVIDVAIKRIEHYQTTPFANDINVQVLEHLRAANNLLDQRIQERVQRGVMNTHNP